jgi:hypothetical protein
MFLGVLDQTFKSSVNYSLFLCPPLHATIDILYLGILMSSLGLELDLGLELGLGIELRLEVGLGLGLRLGLELRLG